MQIIKRRSLEDFWKVHPDAEASLRRWYDITKQAAWTSMNDIQRSFSNAKVLNADRVRFEIGGGDYRMIVAFYFPDKIAFIKFIDTHAAYDKVDALTVDLY